jgi:hypothetical protein
LTARAATVAAVMLFASLTVVACGGGSPASDVVPKSTPDIIPPTNTAAEKAAVQTTSTSTTAKGATGEKSSSASSSEGEGKESSGAPSSSEGSGSSETGGPAGGTSAGEKEKGASSEAPTKEASPTGGANAPSGK